MRHCDLCGTQPIARVVYLGDRSDRRIWLCSSCFTRHEDHELRPDELLTLARCAAQRSGKCEWCGENPPAVQVRVVGAEGRVFAFHLCGPCAQEARSHEGTRVLHPQAAREGEPTVDPRYERAVEIARRRRRMKRVK